LDPDGQAFIAVNNSFAFKNRLSATCLKPAATAAAKDSNITKPETKLNVEISSNGSYEASGEFFVEVSY